MNDSTVKIYLLEPFSPQELEAIRRDYIEYSLLNRTNITNRSYWMEAYPNLSEETRGKIKAGDGYVFDYEYKKRLHVSDNFRHGFMSQIDDKDRLAKLIRNPFLSLALILDEEVVADIQKKIIDDYIEQRTLKSLNPNLDEPEKKAISYKGIIQSVLDEQPERRHNVIKRFLDGYSLSAYFLHIEPIDKKRLQGREEFDVFQRIAGNNSAEIANATLQLVKKKFFSHLQHSISIQEVADKTRDDVEAIIPNPIKKDLLDGSWYLTCLIVMPRYFSEKEGAIFKAKPFSGVIRTREIKGSEISTRSTASFARAITLTEISANTRMADANRPRNRPYGDLRAKPPK